jgi:REP element-mobilizing transposase RayT
MGGDIFLNDEGRRRFLDLLSELVHDFNRAVHAYRLMDNHYHLLIETPEGR